VLGYIFLAGGLLLFLSQWRRKEFGRFLVILVILEILFLSGQAFYRNQIVNCRVGDMVTDRYNGPLAHPAYQLVSKFHVSCPDQDGMYRRAYFRSSLDNLAWIFGSYSALGVDIKPILSSYAEFVGNLTSGYPHELWPLDWRVQFWRNMAVRWFISDKKIKNPEVSNRGRAGALYICEYPEALPRVYFQDRWATGDIDLERKALTEFDLRQVGYMPSDTWELRPLGHIYPDQEELSLEEGIERFKKFQEQNPIEMVDFPSPNRIEVQILNRTPGMLVVADVWHPDWRATVNGCGESVHQVNYLQRGVWLRPGRNLVVMEFIPSSIGPGLAATAAGLVGLCYLVVVSYRQLKKRSRSL